MLWTLRKTILCCKSAKVEVLPDLREGRNDCNGSRLHLNAKTFHIFYVGDLSNFVTRDLATQRQVLDMALYARS
jgi:hypothetical protein